MSEVKYHSLLEAVTAPCREGPESIRQLYFGYPFDEPNPQRNNPKNKYQPKLV